MLVVREFNKEDEYTLKNMVKEITEYDNNFEGLTNIKNIDNYDEFLTKLETNKHQELINENYSPQTTFGMFEDEELIGGFNLRYVLKGDLINHGGNVGYLIRPTQRKKGYGTKILNFAIAEARKINLNKILVTCRKENIASEKVILNNYGIYENDYYDEKNNIYYKRFWIDID